MAIRGVSSAMHEVPDEGARYPDVCGCGCVRDELRGWPLHGGFGGPEARFEALIDHELGHTEGGQIVTVEMAESAHHTCSALGILEICRSSQTNGRGMQFGQDHASPRAKHPAQLLDRIGEVGHVFEG